MTSSKPHVIVLEGPDGGGKSTLASDFAELGYTVRHTGAPQLGEVPYLRYVSSLAQAAMFQRTGINDRPWVFDRLHLGERVYGPILRDRDQLGLTLHRQLDRILMGINGIVVYCATDFETMEKTWRERANKGDELITDTSRYMALFTKYEELIAKSPITFRYDYKQHDLEFVESIPVPWPNPGPGIGAWRPGSVDLIVGEQVSESARGTDWPFTGIHGSSVWLTEQLISANVLEEELYWVNAKRPSGEDLDPLFLSELQPRRIIALGTVARKWAENASKFIESPVIEVPHPQYWKRFRSSEPYPLLEVFHGES